MYQCPTCRYFPPSSSQLVSRFLSIGGNEETKGNETGNEVPSGIKLLCRIGNEGMKRSGG
jgi:hypothetical protein